MELGSLRRAWRRWSLGALLATATLGAAWACSDVVAPVPSSAPQSPRLSLASVAGSNRPAEIRNYGTGDRCLAVQGAGRENGARVIITNCSAGIEQQFTWLPSGQIRVYAGAEAKCLDPMGDGTANGAELVIWDCIDGFAGQQWEAASASAADGAIRLAGTARCLDPWGDGSTAGAQVVTWDCLGGVRDQRWYANLRPAEMTSLADAYGSDNPVVFRSRLTEDRCMDVLGYNTDVGADVGVWTCNGSANQQWRWGVDGLLRTYYGGVERCLIMWGDLSAPDGTPIRVSTCHGDVNERWEPAPDGVGLRLRGTNRCVHIQGADTGVGAHLIIWPCSGWASQQWVARAPERARCAVSMTVIATESDSLMAAYGLPAEADTTAVCESWLGTDYSLNYQTTGSSEWAVPAFADDLRTATYNAGAIAGYDAGGAPIEAQSPVGPTVFDFVNADSATRAGSYDDPYYGIRALDPATTGCADPKQIICDSGAAFSRSSAGTADPTPTTGGGASADTGKRDDKFKRHGLKRRGVRALVDDKDEIARSPEGHRRFRKVTDDEERILTLDARTELLIGEETTSRGRRVKAVHTWKKTRHGQIDAYVRARTDIEETEVIGGKEYRSRATLEFRDVRLY